MHVDFYLDRIVTGGVILESSQEITFHVVEDQKTSPMDVRDFHWLRPGIPSPNYRILQFMPSNRESSMNSSSSAPEHHDNVSSAPIIRTGEAVPAMSPFLDSSLPSSRELLNSGENDEEDELWEQTEYCFIKIIIFNREVCSGAEDQHRGVVEEEEGVNLKLEEVGAEGSLPVEGEEVASSRR